MIKARISRQQILNNIPEQYRHYFNINISDIDQDLYPLFKNFTDAANILCKFAHINKKIDIVFYIELEPTLKMSTVSLNIVLNNEDAVHFYVGQTIFYNLDKAIQYPKEAQITAYLEELVHVFMNVNDEVLVKEIVSSMYEGVAYNKEKDIYEFK
ncbi:hypothetical protein FW755_12325 [Lonepinella koalarum]|uniref:hypothetical protein n=1 Tax=Lonepinella koalarum TaxID=53417 RepID=UPI0011E3D6A5|nr:hypothetical protein [Lonepinella koalarum]TYG33283.1 hypothetical protein FW755_12585 [Lonepinella koalarum]TYG33344.1 hypothetical protein FW755_12325 [Lonepinella koalarum]